MIRREELFELAGDPSQTAFLVAGLQQWGRQSPHEAVNLLRDIFLSPATDPAHLSALAPLVGQTKNHGLFNMVLSAFILKAFTNPLPLLTALKAFENPMAIAPLIGAFSEASWEEKVLIIDTLSKLPSPETIEFFSNLFNDQLEMPIPLTPDQSQTLKKKVGEALSRHLSGF